MILYFTGTGNSRFIAEKMEDRMEDDIISLHGRIKDSITEGLEDDRYVFVVPTYAWRIPKLVSQWILGTELKAGVKAWFVMDCGDGIGNAAYYNQKLCKKKNWQYMGTLRIIMPENYIAMFDAPDREQADRIIMDAIPDIEKAAEIIGNGTDFPEKKSTFLDWLLSALVNPFFYAFTIKDKDFRVTDSCNGCGLCEKKCPLNNIKVTDGKPIWNGNCTHCMACICHCPTEAIEYGEKSVGKPRYHI